MWGKKMGDEKKLEARAPLVPRERGGSRSRKMGPPARGPRDLGTEELSLAKTSLSSKPWF